MGGSLVALAVIGSLFASPASAGGGRAVIDRLLKAAAKSASGTAVADVSGTAGPDDAKLARFADRYLDALLQFEPTWGSAAGMHSYDGQLGDRSAAAIRRETNRLRAAYTEALAFDDKLLSPEARIDRELLESHSRARLLELEEVGAWERRPSYYDAAWSVWELALSPTVANAVAAAARLAAIPALLATARENLSQWARVPLEDGIVRFQLGLRYLDAVPQLFEPIAAAPGGADALRNLTEEVRAAQTAYRSFLEFLRTRREEKMPELIPLGEELFLHRLQYGELVESSVDRILQVTELEMRRLQNELATLARTADSSWSIPDLLDDLPKDVPASTQAPLEARAIVEGIRSFARRQSLVTSPEPSGVEIHEVPPALRDCTVSFVDAPGAFGDSQESPRWFLAADGRGEDALSRTLLKLHAAEDVFPGRALEDESLGANPSRARRLLRSICFHEGWAHYSPAWLIAEGYGAGDPRLTGAVDDDALLTACRCVVAIRLHCRGMGIIQAEEYFEREAFLSRETARREARLAAMDLDSALPAIGSLALGKLQSDLRQAARDKKETFSPGRFHDELLRAGELPIRLHRERLGVAGSTL